MRVGLFSQMVDDVFSLEDTSRGILGVGVAGIGKTQVPMDCASRRGWDLEAICMPLVNPTYLMGYPFRGENGHADHAPFGALSRIMKATRPTIVIMDDLGGASSETCKAALRLFQFREVCGQPLPKCVRLIALTNDVGQGMEIQGLVEPLKDRFVSIVNVEPHIDDTVQYGLANGWPDWQLAYLRNTEKALHDMVPLKSMQRSGATPRGWEGFAWLAKQGLLDKVYGAELAWGAVGKGRATEALAFKGLYRELPDVMSCIMDPEGAPVPDNPSARLMVSYAIASKMDAHTFGQCLRYLNRLPQHFRALSIRDALAAENLKMTQKKVADGYKPLFYSGDFAAWSTSEDGKVVAAASAAAKVK